MPGFEVSMNALGSWLPMWLGQAIRSSLKMKNCFVHLSVDWTLSAFGS